MLRDFWRRPAIVIGAWTVLFVVAFVLRGDLRITSEEATVAVNAQGPVPLIVRPDRLARPRSALIAQKGRVFDAMGFLLVGAEVVPMHRAPERTDADGMFRLELEADSWADVLVRAAGQQPTWLRVAAGSPDALVVRLAPLAPWDGAAELLPPAPTLRGEGNARTNDSQPLANAFVTALGTGIWSRTDATGRFVLPLPSPVATLLLHQPEGGLGGLALLAPPIATNRTHGLMPLPELAAEPAASLRGIVRDPRGSPVAGVPVHVHGDSFDRVVETGSGGAFHVGGLLPGRYQVRPFAFRGNLGVSAEVTLDRPMVDCDLQLRAAEEKRLRVVDESGAPVPSVFVASNADGIRRGVVQADAEGWAALPIAVDMTFDVHTTGTYAPVEVRRYESDAATLVVAMP